MSNPNPPTPIVSVSGNELTSSASDGNQWFINGIKILGSGQQKYIAQQSGNYSVVVTNENNCSSESSSVNIAITGIIMDENISNIHVYPNPTTGIVNLQFPASEKNVFTELYDMGGRVILKTALRDITPNKSYTINLSDVANGVYQMKLSTSNLVINQRLVIAK